MEKETRQLLHEKYHGMKTGEFYKDEKRLAKGEPLAYVIGSQPFLGLTIWLDSHPLIPRVETEWWTNELLQELSGESVFSSKRVGLGLAARSALFRNTVGNRNSVSHKRSGMPKKRVSQHGGARGGDFSAEKDAALFFGIPDLNFLDLCSGSGAVGCAALKLLPKSWHISFGELDPAHKSTIQKNIHENGLDENRATIKIGDLFAPFENERFDCIAINPPYIPINRPLPERVTHYEPTLALFSGDDGLTLIRRIARDAKNHLTEHGILVVECDSPHITESKKIFDEASFASVIHNDQFDRPRIVVSYR